MQSMLEWGPYEAAFIKIDDDFLMRQNFKKNPIAKNAMSPD